MISRLQSRILPRLVNLQNRQRFFNDVGCEDELFYLKNGKLDIDEKVAEINLDTSIISKVGKPVIDERFGVINPDTPKIDKIESPSFNCTIHGYDFVVDENGYVNVYTDGACSSNGLANPKAAIGVWFGDNHPLNVSEPISGRSTSNVAEIMAVTEAARQAKKAGVTKLKIYTDSNFVIMCVTEWMKKWKVSGWITSNKKPVINKNELLELETVLSSLEVVWARVSSHTGIYGNEMAHLLAKKGVSKVK